MLVGVSIDSFDRRMDYQKVDLNHPYLEHFKLYPKYLDPPSYLYVRGRLPTAQPRPKTAAIVGARRCTKYGENIAYNFAYQLAKRGVIIVSGLAYGIDACAHRGCLDAGGVTIAVLGTPIDQIYPRSHQSLAERILEKGAIVSESAPGDPVFRESFLYRNRIVAGLADIVVIVEASDHSGTKYTAERGMEQGKSVYAVPGDISRPMSVGCNKLIKNNCIPCTELDDLLIGLHLKPQEPSRSANYEKYRQCTPEQLKIVACLKAGIDVPDEMSKYLENDLAEIYRQLTLMEIAQLIQREGARFVLVK
jgi:DNA processing protein